MTASIRGRYTRQVEVQQDQAGRARRRGPAAAVRPAPPRRRGRRQMDGGPPSRNASRTRRTSPDCLDQIPSRTGCLCMGTFASSPLPSAFEAHRSYRSYRSCSLDHGRKTRRRRSHATANPNSAATRRAPAGRVKKKVLPRPGADRRRRGRRGARRCACTGPGRCRCRVLGPRVQSAGRCRRCARRCRGSMPMPLSSIATASRPRWGGRNTHPRRLGGGETAPGRLRIVELDGVVDEVLEQLHEPGGVGEHHRRARRGPPRRSRGSRLQVGEGLGQGLVGVGLVQQPPRLPTRE